MHSTRGGWFDSLAVHVRQGGVWTAVSDFAMDPRYPMRNDGTSYEIYTLTFAPQSGDAIRIWGRPGGRDDFISVGELKVYGVSGSIPTATEPPPATATPTPIRTATLTSTPIRTATPTRTSTPKATTTAQPTMTAQPTVVPTATAVATPPSEPTVMATPVPSLCGNGALDPGEQCDGDDAGACPISCHSDCTCTTSFTFPLEGWTPNRGEGQWSVHANPAIMVVDAAEGLSYGIQYPARATLAIPFPIINFTIRGRDDAALEVVAKASDGRSYVLSYETVPGFPTVRRRLATFPVGAAESDDAFRTVARDLAADLRAAFAVDLVSVAQASIRGSLQVKDITLGLPGVLPLAPSHDLEVALPLSGWEQSGLGLAVQDDFDPQLDGPTLVTQPADMKRAKLALAFPDRRRALAAAYRSLSFVVRDDEKLAIEVRVRVQHGVVRLRYGGDLASARIRGRKTTLPITMVPIDGSPYRLVTLDLASDLARVAPGAESTGVVGVRIQGKFRIGDVVLRDPIE